MPARHASNRVMPSLPRGEHVGHAEAARVVEVTAREPVAGHRERLREKILHHRRIGVADGVREADTIHTGVEHGLDETQHFGGFDATLDRAAEGRAKADFEKAARAGGVARGANALDFAHDLVGRATQIGEAVRVARRQRHEHQVGAGFDRPLGALEIGDEHRREKARQRFRDRRRARRCPRAAAGVARGRTNRLRSRAVRPPTRRGSIRASGPSAARARCSASRRAGRLRG